MLAQWLVLPCDKQIPRNETAFGGTAESKHGLGLYCNVHVYTCTVGTEKFPFSVERTVNGNQMERRIPFFSFSISI